jgi:hypothetical protein
VNAQRIEELIFENQYSRFEIYSGLELFIRPLHSVVHDERAYHTLRTKIPDGRTKIRLFEVAFVHIQRSKEEGNLFL